MSVREGASESSAQTLRRHELITLLRLKGHKRIEKGTQHCSVEPVWEVRKANCLSIRSSSWLPSYLQLLYHKDNTWPRFNITTTEGWTKRKKLDFTKGLATGHSAKSLCPNHWIIWSQTIWQRLKNVWNMILMPQKHMIENVLLVTKATSACLVCNVEFSFI